MPASRRSFLGSAAAALATLALPERLLPQGRSPGLRVPPGPLDEPFWQELRTRFLIPPDEAFFNTGTLGSQPRRVVEAVMAHMTHVARDIAHWDYQPDHEQYFTGYAPELGVRTKLASLINADVAEVGLTQNATMGMNFLASGLELGTGEEIVAILNEHPGGRCGWEVREKRHGARVIFVPPPAPAESPEQLIALYEGATTPRTRVWAIPHLTSGQGAILFPVAELCRRARDRGILSVIDGAQTVGHLAVDVKAMGCDAFFSSTHKWLLAPVGTGMLYIRREAQPHFWTTLASSQWDNHADGMYRLMQYGTGNLSLLVGLEEAIDFHVELGSARVEERVLTLSRRLREGLRGIDRTFIRSPAHPALLTGTTIWGIDGVSGAELQNALWERGKVRVRSSGDGVRQCCHIYTTMDDVERSLETTRRIASQRR